MWALRSGNHPTQQDAVWLSGIAQKYHNKKMGAFSTSSGLTFRLVKDAFVFCSVLRERTFIHRQKWMLARSKSWENKRKGETLTSIYTWTSLIACQLDHGLLTGSECDTCPPYTWWSRGPAPYVWGKTKQQSMFWSDDAQRHSLQQHSNVRYTWPKNRNKINAGFMLREGKPKHTMWFDSEGNGKIIKWVLITFYTYFKDLDCYYVQQDCGSTATQCVTVLWDLMTGNPQSASHPLCGEYELLKWGRYHLCQLLVPWDPSHLPVNLRETTCDMRCVTCIVGYLHSSLLATLLSNVFHSSCCERKEN